MNIVIIPAFFQTKARPTVGSFFMEQALALQKAGHQVTILYCDTYSVKCIGEWLHYVESPATQMQGVRIYRNKCFCPLKHGMEGHKEAFARGILRLWKRYMTDSRVDIIHAHCCVWAGYAAMQLSRCTQIPYVITEHATLFQLHKDEISAANHRAIAETFQNAARVICVSRAFGRLLEEYTTNIEIIGNVVDCDRFCIENADTADRNTMIFLTVCYMQEEAQLYKKGLDVLLQAWEKFVVLHPEARLKIGGGGKAAGKVREWMAQYHVEGSVELLEALDRDQVAQQMQQCDFFVLPSRYETFGVVYIEAFACGKPVIAVANGGPDDFVTDLNGILLEECNADLLFAAMCDMIEHRMDYQPQQIRHYAQEHFSQESIAKQLDVVYRSVLCRHD